MFGYRLVHGEHQGIAHAELSQAEDTENRSEQRMQAGILDAYRIDQYRARDKRHEKRDYLSADAPNDIARCIGLSTLSHA